MSASEVLIGLRPKSGEVQRDTGPIRDQRVDGLTNGITFTEAAEIAANHKLPVQEQLNVQKMMQCSAANTAQSLAGVAIPKSLSGEAYIKSRERRILHLIGGVVLACTVGLAKTPGCYLHLRNQVRKGVIPSVFYIGERVGVDGQVLKVRKFRTLKPGSDKKVTTTMYSTDRALQVSRKTERMRSNKGDELPQLLSVIRGKMALFGPRAFDKKEERRYLGELDEQILAEVLSPIDVCNSRDIQRRVRKVEELEFLRGRWPQVIRKVGCQALIGPQQVVDMASSNSDKSLKEGVVDRMRGDIRYVEHASLLNDAKGIIALSVVVCGKIHDKARRVISNTLGVAISTFRDSENSVAKRQKKRTQRVKSLIG